METSSARVRGRRLAASGSLLAIVMTTALSLTLVTPGAATAGRGHHPSPPSGPVVVATGLDNPRQLSFDGHDLYVAEAGTGGDLACRTGPEGGEVCMGESGSVTKIDWWGQRRVLTGLPSMAAPNGTRALGPADIAVDDGRYALLMALGADPALRDEAGVPEFAQQFGTLLGGTLRGRDHSWRRGGHGSHGYGPRVLADVSGYEADANPDGAQVDSNPVGLWSGRHGWVVADAGGNDVLGVGWWGDVSTLGVFPTRLVPPPPFLPPGDIPMDAVPTSAVLGPDGALYVSQLTGFPFPPNGANIWRLVPGQAPTVYASGLTNVTDLAWSRDGLYAVQLSDAGLLTVPEGQPPTGSLVRIGSDGGHETVAAGLVAPYGLALSERSAYVTTCSVCPGAGEVVRISLR
ncbi:ScyD/ScyE family protein [Nocardioides sp.]|uniref:ScyD/ScyE family protein n=1 Tax=Nocardioides sp. TaxID=35761 RepID=UPI00261A49CD|nr:ScyD/ScyE family protein [Nocardioides sp.]MCW2736008.1 ScyD/ScyE family protein [Nocardioides sp.]